MGMLDEAIREHFDLKRRNGADPAVVAIEEREALGDPAQRQAQVAEVVSTEEEGTHTEALTVSAEADGVVVAEVPNEEPATRIVEPGELEQPPAAAQEDPVPTAEELPGSEAAVAEEEIVAEAPEQETRGFTLEESQEAVMPEPPSRPVGAPPSAEPQPAAEEAAPGEQAEEARDELEGTPEFLEETPEHDRLWFERKPPRDFDF